MPFTYLKAFLSLGQGVRATVSRTDSMRARTPASSTIFSSFSAGGDCGGQGEGRAVLGEVGGESRRAAAGAGGSGAAAAGMSACGIASAVAAAGAVRMMPRLRWSSSDS